MIDPIDPYVPGAAAPATLPSVDDRTSFFPEPSVCKSGKQIEPGRMCLALHNKPGVQVWGGKKSGGSPPPIFLCPRISGSSQGQPNGADTLRRPERGLFFTLQSVTISTVLHGCRWEFTRKELQ